MTNEENKLKQAVKSIIALVSSLLTIGLGLSEIIFKVVVLFWGQANYNQMAGKKTGQVKNFLLTIFHPFIMIVLTWERKNGTFKKLR